MLLLDSTIVESTFVFTLREGDRVTTEHDPHTTGLLPRNTLAAPDT